MAPLTVRAAELAAFEFCQRAWFYARTGASHDQYDVMQAGTRWHETVQRRARRSIVLTRLGILLFLAGIGTFIVYSLRH